MIVQVHRVDLFGLLMVPPLMQAVFMIESREIQVPVLLPASTRIALRIQFMELQGTANGPKKNKNKYKEERPGLVRPGVYARACVCGDRDARHTGSDLPR